MKLIPDGEDHYYLTLSTQESPELSLDVYGNKETGYQVICHLQADSGEITKIRDIAKNLSFFTSVMVCCGIEKAEAGWVEIKESMGFWINTTETQIKTLINK